MHVQSQCCIVIPFTLEYVVFALCFVLCNLKSSYLIALGIINMLTTIDEEQMKMSINVVFLYEDVKH